MRNWIALLIQFITGLLSCVVNYVTQSPCAMEALNLHINLHLNPSIYFPRVCICLISADFLSLCPSLYEILGPVCMNWQVCVTVWCRSGQEPLELGLGLYFEVTLIVLSKFEGDQPFIEFSSRSWDGWFSGAESWGGDCDEALPISPAEELDLQSKLNYFRISRVSISNSIWGAICSKYVGYLATRQINKSI